MDPDLMTWSIFADFPSENGVSAPVENVWYKLANEDLAYVRAIPEDRDSGIRQLCSEALICGEVDIFIEQDIFINFLFGVGHQHFNSSQGFANYFVRDYQHI